MDHGLSSIGAVRQAPWHVEWCGSALVANHAYYPERVFTGLAENKDRRVTVKIHQGVTGLGISIKRISNREGQWVSAYRGIPEV